MPLAVQAQRQENKIRRIGFLAAPVRAPLNVDAFRQGLLENGHVEGRNLLIEQRSAEGLEVRLPALAAELVRLKVEIIVTEGASAARAAKQATADIPIVFTFVADPVASGLVSTLARPGGNITGITTAYRDLTGKRLEILKEAIPALKFVVLLANPANRDRSADLREATLAAGKLGLGVRVVEVGHRSELEPAFTSIARERALAVVLMPDAFFFTHRVEILERATKGRLTVIGWIKPLAESGALISYGPVNVEMLRRAAALVDKILKGAKPADLPVEQPTKFELVINARTAKALGLTIPPSLLVRADHVFE